MLYWDTVGRVCAVLEKDMKKFGDRFPSACAESGRYQPLALDSTYAPFLFGYHLARYIGEDAIADMADNGGWGENELVAKAAQDMIDFVNAGYLAEGAPAEYPASQDSMGIDGDVAMVVCANYVTSEVNLHSGTELNWSVFNYPSVEGAAEGVDQSAAYAGANSIAVTSYSDQDTHSLATSRSRRA